MLAGPAFAKKAQQATYNYGSVVLSGLWLAGYSAIPGYDNEGNVVAIPDSDQSGPSRR